MEDGSTRVRIILASRSPRRIEFLRGCGIDCEITPADIPEIPRTGESPEDAARRLAREKAFAVAGLAGPTPALILAADTVVADGEVILGKPADATEARAMLLRLRGREHQVVTAVCLRTVPDGVEHTETAVTGVWMRHYETAEIDAYLASGDGMDKAGAYAIQSAAFRPVARFEGCYSNVVGLPVCRVYALLEKCGYAPARPLPEGCRTSRRCAFQDEVVRGDPRERNL